MSQSIYSSNKKIVAHSFRPSSPIHNIERFNVSGNSIKVTIGGEITSHEISEVRHTGTEKEIRTFVFQDKEYALIQRKDNTNIIKEINKKSLFGIYLWDENKKHGIGRYATTDLATFLKKNTRCLKSKLNWMQDLLLDYYKLHNQGKIHSDIKLENVLIGKNSSNVYFVGIIDLGRSQRLNGEHPLVGSSNNTPPEVYKTCINTTKVRSNTAIDIWGIGTMFIQIITKKKLTEFLIESFKFEKFKMPICWDNRKWEQFHKYYYKSRPAYKERLMYHLLNTNYANFYYSKKFNSNEGRDNFLTQLSTAIKKECRSEDAKKVIDIIIPCLNIDPKMRPSLTTLYNGLDSLIDPNRQRKRKRPVEQQTQRKVTDYFEKKRRSFT